MSDPVDSYRLPAGYSGAGPSFQKEPISQMDARLPLLNLAAVRTRMDSLQSFLSQSVNSNTLLPKDQMDMVSYEISSAIQQIIVNGAALLSCAQKQSELPGLAMSSAATLVSGSDLKLTKKEINNDYDDEGNLDENEEDCEIVELDAVELLAEHIHFCEICGKGFKRDANLRMHMRAHGNQYKTPEALSKKGGNKLEQSSALSGRKTRFSCPYEGCNRNKKHKRFRPLKSVICVRNHFKRSHCPKMYSCNRCHKKSFSVLADLKSHLKNCGGEEKKWKCSCGNSFSRKDKLFGHMALFEGHMPAVAAEDDDEKLKGVAPMEEDEEKEQELGEDSLEDGFFDGLLNGFNSVENFCFQDMFSSYNGL
ncbi:hypothetical protein SLEP1_g33158 [Rubroshorea leprosula]|uniref:C2H2-type domain-containing protein n=1 Tax=Rubroshorea leprosula TaxID=152421 RepID=A0AAV5KFX2_9ROSI|nr:hypothetical protein SLEP1_g33158 [Rubroshorea leprosula]